MCGQQSRSFNLQAVKNVLRKVLETVMTTSNPGWLEAAIDSAVVSAEKAERWFSSRMLQDAVTDIQNKRRTSEVLLTYS